ncbi:arylsulfotransferase family protein [Salinibacter ruber]|uniref:arylsulfotransferase family protein n=1 Tax=Salinibacter ruber TaxID=146919 RepID=UPI0021696B65
MSEKGDVLKRMNVLDILYNNDLQRYISKADQPQAGTRGPLWKSDVSHINDVEPLSSSLSREYPLFDAGDLLISLRNLHLVFVLDPGSGEVKWHASDPFITQHDPDFIGGGWIGVFDNNEDFTKRGRMNGGSRIIALQPHTDSLRVLFPTKRSENFYTAIRGKWQKLENGNMLLTEANAGRVVEVAPNGETVWEWIHSPITKSRVAPVTEGTHYDLTQEDVASWPCSSVDSVDASSKKQQTAP